MLTTVIFSGGSGTRLWPSSRESRPKQLLAPTGQHTMLQETARHLNGFGGGNLGGTPTIVVCNHEHRLMVAEQLRATGVEGVRIALEPIDRNTAPALTLTACLPVRDGRAPTVLVMSADHVFTDSDAFHAAVSLGHDAARSGALEIAAFVEKPDSERARKYVSLGQYLWNSGLHTMRATVWVEALAALQPGMSAACRDALEHSSVDADFVRVDSAPLASCPSDSTDDEVIEKLSRQASAGIPGGGVPMSAGWPDVGAWDTTSEVMSKGAHGNTTHTDTILDGCEDSLLYGGKRLVAGFGLKDVIAVETLDAVLGADKSRTHVVKGIVTRIKAEASPTRTTRSTALDAGTTPSISVTASRPSAPRPIRTPSSTHRCTTNAPNTGSLLRARPKPPTVTKKSA